jgi:hypothetical protein
MSEQFFCGTFGDFVFGSTALKVVKWEFKDMGTEAETTSKASNGYYTSVICKHKGEITFEAHFDGIVMLTPPIPIYTGALGTFNLYIDAADLAGFSGTCLVTSMAYTSDANSGVFGYSGTAVAQGSYTLPSGVVNS